MPRLPAFLVALAIIVATSLTTSGCAAIYSSISDHPVDEYHGKRTWSARLMDQGIETKIRTNLYIANPEFRKSHLSIVSFNGNVLLAGQVGSIEMVKRAESIARDIRWVRTVENELSHNGQLSFFAHANDNWISAKAKLRFLFTPGVPGNRIKVKTENSTLYLMGLVTREEADLATASSKKVYGVQKIVRIFEYIN